MKFVHVFLKSETGKLDSDFSTARGAPSFHVQTNGWSEHLPSFAEQRRINTRAGVGIH